MEKSDLIERLVSDDKFMVDYFSDYIEDYKNGKSARKIYMDILKGKQFYKNELEKSQSEEDQLKAKENYKKRTSIALGRLSKLWENNK